MPAASVWVNDGSNPKPSTTKDSAQQRAPSKPAPTRQHSAGAGHRRPARQSAAGRKSDVWVRGQDAPLSRASSHPHRAAAREGFQQRPALNLHREKLLHIQQQEAEQLRKADETRRKAQRAEEMQRRREQERARVLAAEEQSNRAAAAEVARYMESSERLKRKRIAHQEKHKDDIAAKEALYKELEMAKLKLEAKRQTVKHVLQFRDTYQKAYHKLFMLPPTARLDDFETSWKRISKRVHPDVCQLPDAAEAFDIASKAINYVRDKARDA